VAQLGLEGNWNRAQDVLFGEVANAVRVGAQRITHAPWPVGDSVHKIYWCQADFHPFAVVKGAMPAPGEQVLWAVIRPDCSYGLPSDSSRRADQAPITRVWFLREEGEYLRPAVDGGLFFVPFRWKWTDTPKEAVPRLFVSLLFDPVARGLSADRYESAVLEAGEVALTILPKADVLARMKLAAGQSTPTVRGNICSYLTAKFDVDCR
jgi:hypothetical protein